MDNSVWDTGIYQSQSSVINESRPRVGIPSRRPMSAFLCHFGQRAARSARWPAILNHARKHRAQVVAAHGQVIASEEDVAISFD